MSVGERWQAIEAVHVEAVQKVSEDASGGGRKMGGPRGPRCSLVARSWRMVALKCMFGGGTCAHVAALHCMHALLREG